AIINVNQVILHVGNAKVGIALAIPAVPSSPEAERPREQGLDLGGETEAPAVVRSARYDHPSIKYGKQPGRGMPRCVAVRPTTSLDRFLLTRGTILLPNGIKGAVLATRSSEIRLMPAKMLLKRLQAGIGPHHVRDDRGQIHN